jgi:hypothetical protein
MESITVAMMVYVVLFAVLIFAISIHRGVKRNREMKACLQDLPKASRPEESAPSQPSTDSKSPHDAPSAKHAA